MDFIWDLFTKPFIWGLLLGLLFAGYATWSRFRTAREFSRYKRHLSDKLELEADGHGKLKSEKEKLARENENLRIKIGGSKDPARELQRQLEIFARAEKSMMINAPGFAGAWETAKSAAMAEVNSEERGESLPRKIFRKLAGSTKALPDHREAEDSGEDEESTAKADKSTT